MAPPVEPPAELSVAIGEVVARTQELMSSIFSTRSSRTPRNDSTKGASQQTENLPSPGQLASGSIDASGSTLQRKLEVMGERVEALSQQQQEMLEMQRAGFGQVAAQLLALVQQQHRAMEDLMARQQNTSHTNSVDVRASGGDAANAVCLATSSSQPGSRPVSAAEDRHQRINTHVVQATDHLVEDDSMVA